MKSLLLTHTALLLLLVGVTLCVRDPYTKTDATSADENQGATADFSYLYIIGTGHYVGFKQLNFSQETLAFEWHFYNDNAYYLNNKVSLRLDSPTTQPFLTHNIPSGDGHWVEYTALIPVDERPRGVHDLYFTFQHQPGNLYFKWFRFVSLESLLPPATALCPNATTAIDCPTPPSIDCPTPQPVDCPQPIPCPPLIECPLTTTQSSVQRQSEGGMSVEHKCDNTTDRSNHVVINFY